MPSSSLLLKKVAKLWMHHFVDHFDFMVLQAICFISKKPAWKICADSEWFEKVQMMSCAYLGRIDASLTAQEVIAQAEHSIASATGVTLYHDRWLARMIRLLWCLRFDQSRLASFNFSDQLMTILIRVQPVQKLCTGCNQDLSGRPCANVWAQLGKIQRKFCMWAWSLAGVMDPVPLRHLQNLRISNLYYHESDGFGRFDSCTQQLLHRLHSLDIAFKLSGTPSYQRQVKFLSLQEKAPCSGTSWLLYLPCQWQGDEC